ncbi:MAG: polysaccharide deacetylase family protein [Thermodesulfovibrionales bacterium]|nr:polysaccharide deacetylase family protein [Thermodesulfovibrionales bacterium]
MKKILLILVVLILLSACTLKQAYVSITFDDGYASVYKDAFPILSKYDFPATVFVVTSYIGNLPDFMSWGQLYILTKHGKWEIGSHSHTHPNFTKLKRSEIENELNHSKEILISKGFSPVGFASPYGQFDETVLESIKKSYFYHRNAGRPPWLNSLYNIDVFNINAVTIYYDTSFEEMKVKIDRAIAEKKWLVLVIHDVVKGKPKSYQINLELLEKTLRYLKEHNVKVVTIKDFLTAQGLLK